MIRKLPLIPTLLVLVAVGIMVRLGFWQLDRLHQKEAMLAQYESASHATKVTDFKSDLMVDGPGDYRLARLQCRASTGDNLISGRNAQGQAGWAHQFGCEYPTRMWGLREAEVVIGWSVTPTPVKWTGGDVQGTLVPSKGRGRRLIADPPLAGLQPNAKPDPATIPNNHLAYAVQWFLFAGVALVIYVLALSKRVKAG